MNTPHMVATFLDPRYKSLKFLPAEKKQDLKQYVADLCEEFVEAAPTCQDAIKKEDEPETPQECESSILSCLIGDVEVDLTETSTSMTKEMDSYETEPVRTIDPLLWWNSNATRYISHFNHCNLFTSNSSRKNTYQYQ